MGSDLDNHTKIMGETFPIYLVRKEGLMQSPYLDNLATNWSGGNRGNRRGDFSRRPFTLNSCWPATEVASTG
jgi:hypothetical protein